MSTADVTTQPLAQGNPRDKPAIQALFTSQPKTRTGRPAPWKQTFAFPAYSGLHDIV